MSLNLFGTQSSEVWFLICVSGVYILFRSDLETQFFTNLFWAPRFAFFRHSSFWTLGKLLIFNKNGMYVIFDHVSKSIAFQGGWRESLVFGAYFARLFAWPAAWRVFFTWPGPRTDSLMIIWDFYIFRLSRAWSCGLSHFVPLPNTPPLTVTVLLPQSNHPYMNHEWGLHPREVGVRNLLMHTVSLPRGCTWLAAAGLCPTCDWL